MRAASVTEASRAPVVSRAPAVSRATVVSPSDACCGVGGRDPSRVREFRRPEACLLKHVGPWRARSPCPAVTVRSAVPGVGPVRRRGLTRVSSATDLTVIDPTETDPMETDLFGAGRACGSGCSEVLRARRRAATGSRAGAHMRACMAGWRTDLLPGTRSWGAGVPARTLPGLCRIAGRTTGDGRLLPLPRLARHVGLLWIVGSHALQITHARADSAYPWQHL